MPTTAGTTNARSVSWGVGSASSTSNPEKSLAIENLLTKFVAGHRYQDLLNHVKSNLDVLAFKNLANSFSSNFAYCEVSTTMQEALVLLAMKKFGIALPSGVTKKHITAIVDDVLLLSPAEYDLSTNQHKNILHLAQTDCNVSKGQTALAAKFDKTYQITTEYIKAIVNMPSYQPPVVISMALRSPDKYQNFSNEVLPDDTSNQGRKSRHQDNSKPTNVSKGVTINSVWETSQLNGIPVVPRFVLAIRVAILFLIYNS